MEYLTSHSILILFAFSAVLAEHKSINGMIKSAWKKNGNNVTINVTIPTNTTAEVYVPAVSVDGVTENGTDVIDAEGVKFNRVDGSYIVFDVLGGQYQFLSNEASGKLQ